MEAYRRWVRSNKDCSFAGISCQLLEIVGQGLTWLLPERFSASEIGPEAVTATFGIITAINEHIIDTTPTQMPGGPVESYAFPYSLCISAMKDLETLIEVAAEHYYGEHKKWNFIAVTEAINGYKMLLHGGETPNVEKDSNLSSQGFSKPGSHHRPDNLQYMNGHNQWNLEGRALSALIRFGENARMVSDPVWLSRIRHQQAIMQPPAPIVERPTLATILSEKGFHGALYVMGETLIITRPLIYVLFIRKYGIWSWIPWLVSLGVDFVGLGFLTQIAKSKHAEKGQQFHLTDSEKDELRRRKLLWALYLMRDPFFSKYTRQRLENTGKLLEPVPLIGLLTGKVVELIIGAQTRYTYMSGS